MNITRDSVQEILEGRMASPREAMHGFAIVIDGKFYRDGTGKFLWKTRPQAVKSFYNTLAWRSRSILWAAEHPEDSWGWYRNPDFASTSWREFKRVLKDNYNFDIIEI